MQKTLLASLISLTVLASPLPSLAAYNDVTLETGTTVFSVNGIDLNVTGSNAVIESAVAGDTTLTLSVPAGSSVQVESPDLNRITVSPVSGTGLTVTCSSNLSQVQYTANSGSLTLVLTPTTDSCSGGGGGSGSSPRKSSSSSTTTTTPVTPPPAGSIQAQINALLVQIAALQAQLSGSLGAISSFARDLQFGSSGEDVLALQRYLNAHGFAVATVGAGALGSETTTFGPATRAALIQFQAAKGISPAAGYFGPITRAYVLSNP